MYLGRTGVTNKPNRKRPLAVQDQPSFAHCRRGLLGRMSRHRTATPLPMVKIRCQSDAGVKRELHERGSVAAVHVVTAAALHDGHDGLSCLRKICKAHPCVNWT